MAAKPSLLPLFMYGCLDKTLFKACHGQFDGFSMHIGVQRRSWLVHLRGMKFGIFIELPAKAGYSGNPN